MSNPSGSIVASPHSFATGASLSEEAGSVMLSLLDSAAEQFIINKDFEAVFDTCDRALQNLANSEQEDNRSDIKAGFCILGIQALAELNEWRRVLPWVLQLYECPEKIPAKILQMCILLYSKVGEPGVMLDVTSVWLHCLANSRASGFGTVTELYLLHVLIPLGHMDEVWELIWGAVGICALTEDQRQTVIDIVEEKEHQNNLAQNPAGRQSSNTSLLTTKPQGALLNKLGTILKHLYRKLLASSRRFHLYKIFLIALLVYMLFIRMDPAQPSSFLWVSKLHQLLTQMWTALLAPYNAPAHKKIL